MANAVFGKLEWTTMMGSAVITLAARPDVFLSLRASGDAKGHQLTSGLGMGGDVTAQQLKATLPAFSTITWRPTKVGFVGTVELAGEAEDLKLDLLKHLPAGVQMDSLEADATFQTLIDVRDTVLKPALKP